MVTINNIKANSKNKRKWTNHLYIYHAHNAGSHG